MNSPEPSWKKTIAWVCTIFSMFLFTAFLFEALTGYAVSSRSRFFVHTRPGEAYRWLVLAAGALVLAGFMAAIESVAMRPLKRLAFFIFWLASVVFAYDFVVKKEPFGIAAMWLAALPAAAILWIYDGKRA